MPWLYASCSRLALALVIERPLHSFGRSPSRHDTVNRWTREWSLMGAVEPATLPKSSKGARLQRIYNFNRNRLSILGFRLSGASRESSAEPPHQSR